MNNSLYKEWQITNIGEYILFLRHEKAYHYASEYCSDKVVLDFGCGIGYGSAILSKTSKEILGVDIDKDAINYCIKNYPLLNLSFQKIDQYPLPFEDKSFDIIIAFNVIEHIPNVQECLNELKRLLTKDGILLISTPNSKKRSFRFRKIWNPDHLREYDFLGFKKELKNFFNSVVIKGIYGTKEVNKIDNLRIRELRNPFIIYLYRPIRYRVKKLLTRNIALIFTRLEQKYILKSKRALNPSLCNKYNLNNIIIGNDFKNSSVFLAICQNK